MRVEKDTESFKTNKWLFVLLLVFILILLIPSLLTSFSVLDFTETGQIGDTIGGITAPFIGFLSAYLVYKAFEEQRRANNYQLNLIKAQLHDREFSIFFKLLEDLRSYCREGKSIGKSSTVKFELFIEYIVTDRISIEEPSYINQLLDIERFLDQFVFVVRFIEGCDSSNKSFFSQKFKVDFDVEIKGFSKFYYAREIIEGSSEYVLVEDILQKIKEFVNFIEETIRDEKSSN